MSRYLFRDRDPKGFRAHMEKLAEILLEKGGQLSTTMDNLIGDIIEALRRGYTLEDGERVMQKHDFSIRDMIRCIEEHPSIGDLYKPATRTALIQRLRRANRLGVFVPGGTSVQDLAVAGQVTVIDVAPLGSDAEPVLAVLTKIDKLGRVAVRERTLALAAELGLPAEELQPTSVVTGEGVADLGESILAVAHEETPP